MDFINEFKLALMDFGLVPPDNIVADGKRHRFSSDGSARDKNGWYILYGDNLPAGAFGCWKNQISEKWKSSEKKTFTPEQRAEYAQRIKDVEQERADAEQRDREYAKTKSAEMWAQATDVPIDHPYMVRKQIQAIGIKALNGELLIPVRANSRDMVGLQRIPFEAGALKKPVYGTPMQGSYFTIGVTKATTTIVIVEGYATGVSVHMATGHGVVVAFNAGNLLLVAQKIRKAMPDIEIILAADDDWKTVYPPNHEKAGQLWNVGMIAATDAAMMVGGRVCVPVFNSTRGDKDTDFNDLHVSEGLDTVKHCFNSRAKAHDEIIPPMIEVVFDKSDKNAVKKSTASVEVETPNNSVNVNSGPPYHEDHIVQSTPVAAGVDVKPFVVSRHNIVAHYNLDASDKGVPFVSVANIVRVLQGDSQLYRKIWFDEFLGRIMTVWRGDDPREWADIDDINLQIYLQESLGMPKLGKFTVADAVHAIAYADTRNECQAYINGLVWDGVERLPMFLQNAYGVIDSEYHRGVSQVFWISMVARAIKPGCQNRTMIVLEGLQNAGKSKSLNIIGGKWFAEASESPTSKDFYLALRGKLLLEIGEMDAFNRTDVNKIKQVISCQSDNYRAPYERRSADHPRSCVFAGTTNRDDWNKDETGGTRFLPISCVKIDLDYLINNRDQFFAEALIKFKTIPEYWNLVPQEDARKEQELRRDHDTLEDDILGWLKGRTEVAVRDIMSDLMDLEIAKQDKMTQMRIAKCLRAMGWIKVTARRSGGLVKVWQLAGSAQESAL